MSVTTESLRNLEQHWAVQAVGKIRRERARQVAEYRLVYSAVGNQMSFEFAVKAEDEEWLEQVAAAYEVAAIEGLDAVLHQTAASKSLRDQAKAGAFRAYELRRVLVVPSENMARIFHLLHLASVAYCGDRSADLRRWLRENPRAVSVPSVAEVTWDRRVLYRLFDCWLRLFRKNQWDDLNSIHEIIAGLREDQKRYEAGLLKPNGTTDENSHSSAYRLIALYHWAKATEFLAVYMLQGDNAAITANLDQHFEAARHNAESARDIKLEMLLRWLHVASRQMVSASIWYVARAVNSRVSRFVEKVTKTRSLFELLPPQRAAIQEQGLLDQANRAVVVNLPTSGGKTILAQFRMLQALNQFDADEGWVTYVAPTRALVAQITRQLRTDFESLGVNVEALSTAIEIDSCEESLLSATQSTKSFHILVTTPEKLSLVIRNKKVSRPLALAVIDEAHNLEDEERGLRIELLLATIKQDCPTANFLLLMPYVPNAEDLTKWLAPESGKTISFGTSAWLPNERIIGIFNIERDSSVRGGWKLLYETLTTTPKTIHLKGRHQAGDIKPLNLSYTDANSLTNATGAMAKVLCERGTSVAVASKIPHTWTMARNIAASLPALGSNNEDITLVQRFLETEISPDFELISLLDKGVAVHHAGLSEETRSLIEWLTEQGHLRVLCATTTIAQGLNFPVSSVFLADRKFPYGKEMPKRAFWNLAGRAGRISHDSVGVVGIAAGNNPNEVINFVKEAHEELVSRLVVMLREMDNLTISDLTAVIERDEWVDFRSYIAHLWNETQNLQTVLAATEQTLRNTLGYQKLRASPSNQDKRRAEVLLEATKQYVRRLSEHPENAALADATGFSPEGVRTALLEMNQLEKKLRPSDWQPESLFGSVNRSSLPQLVGIMMKIPQIRKSLEEIGGSGKSQRHIAEIAQAWVTGEAIGKIAEKYFKDPNDESLTNAITDACKGIYRTLGNAGTWGLSALSKMPTSGLDFDNLPEATRRAINTLPAMLYHGVYNEEAVMMRINSVPRTIANSLGELFATQSQSGEIRPTVRQVREFLRQLPLNDWQKAAPKKAAMSGKDYREVWRKLSGESD